MKRSIPQFQYHRLLALYHKLNARLNRYFSSGRFHQFSKQQQYKLVQRIERIKAQLVRLEHGIKLAGTCLFVGATFLVSDAEAQFAPVGSEFLVNSFTTDIQRQPALAMDADGDFVMLWQSEGQDGSDYGIYGQRFNAAGLLQGTEFLVHTKTFSSQSDVCVAMDADGDFVVTWEDFSYGGSNDGIFARRYNAMGIPQGTDFLVNTYTTSNQSNSAVAMDSDGDFVVVWDSNNQDGSGHGVYAQRYSADGSLQGGEFQVNTFTSSAQYFPSVAMDSDGNFVIVWQGRGGQDPLGIYGQRYNSLGLVQGSEFIINSYTSLNQIDVSVAMDADGDFVVAWSSKGQDGDDYGIYGQRYSADGLTQGNEFQVNTYTTGVQKKPSVSIDSNGNFVIIWQSEGQDGMGFGVYGQRYNADGTMEGEEFMVNTYTANNQQVASVAMDSDGDFIVIWESYGQDGSDYGVYAQRYNGGFATPTAVQNAQEVLDMNLYPNPAKDEVHFNVEGEVSIKVLTLSGQVLRQEVLENQTFHVSGLKPGLYLVEIEKEGEKKMKKLVVE